MNRVEQIKYRLEKNKLLNPLERNRRMINGIDRMVVWLLIKRDKPSTNIGKYKIRKGLSFVDNGRWGSHLKDLKDQGAAGGLDESYIEAVFDPVHEHSVGVQAALQKKS